MQNTKNTDHQNKQNTQVIGIHTGGKTIVLAQNTPGLIHPRRTLLFQ